VGWFGPIYPERRKVVVNTKDDRALRGFLWERNREYLLLKNAELVEGDARPIPMDGEVIIYARDVSFLQVLVEIS
jgi:hypothetical protein